MTDFKTILKYIPHGINTSTFYPISNVLWNASLEESHKDSFYNSLLLPKNYDSMYRAELEELEQLRKQMFGDDEVEFVVMYNNRNIRRKMTSDVVLAFRKFWLSLPKEQAEKTRLLMHTQPVDDNGTDLYAVTKACAPEIKVVFSEQRVPPNVLNRLYNLSDVVINMASNEGFGLGTLEAMLAGKMIVVNITGGLQDQVGFVDGEGKYLDANIHYDESWGSNHDGKYKTHGKWAGAVFPNNRSLNGSPSTPYIFDDRCDWNEAGMVIRSIYDMPPEERVQSGLAGRVYAIEEGFTAKAMCDNFVEGFEHMFDTWVPRPRFTMHKG